MELNGRLPLHHYAPHQKPENFADHGARHKILLELGEALVIYLSECFSVSTSETA